MFENRHTADKRSISIICWCYPLYSWKPNTVKKKSPCPHTQYLTDFLCHCSYLGYSHKWILKIQMLIDCNSPPKPIICVGGDPWHHDHHVFNQKHGAPDDNQKQEILGRCLIVCLPLSMALTPPFTPKVQFKVNHPPIHPFTCMQACTHAQDMHASKYTHTPRKPTYNGIIVIDDPTKTARQILTNHILSMKIC